MVVSKAAYRYAKSLLGLALERGVAEVAQKDMAYIAGLCRDNKDLVILLKSPVINADKKSHILAEVFSDHISEISRQFVEIILRKGREMHLPGIAESFNEQYKEHKKIVTAKVTTAVALDESLRARILAIVMKQTGREVQLVEQVDQSIIGGFVLRIGDIQLDESISNKINDMRKEFAKNTYVRQY